MDTGKILKESGLSEFNPMQKKAIDSGNSDSKTQELYRKRQESARDYLNKLVQISPRWQSLEREFESAFSSKDAYTRAA